MNKVIPVINHFIGLGSNKTSHREKIISGLGGFIGILLILIITRQFVEINDAGLIVASMGASAVLIFAVPHGPLSQPWALGCGHLVSAVIGVSCYLFIPNLFVAAASAVGPALYSSSWWCYSAYSSGRRIQCACARLHVPANPGINQCSNHILCSYYF